MYYNFKKKYKLTAEILNRPMRLLEDIMGPLDISTWSSIEYKFTEFLLPGLEAIASI